MSNIIERLRSATPYSPPQIELAHTAHDAADVMAAMLEALEAMSAHYSASLDHQPAYVALGRAAIKAAKGE